MKTIGIASRLEETGHARKTLRKCLSIKGLRGRQIPRLLSRGPIEAYAPGLTRIAIE